MQLRHLPGVRPDCSTSPAPLAESIDGDRLIEALQEFRRLEDLLVWIENRLADGDARWGACWPSQAVLDRALVAACDRLEELRSELG